MFGMNQSENRLAKLREGFSLRMQNVSKKLDERFEPIEKRWESFRQKPLLGLIFIIVGLAGASVIIGTDIRRLLAGEPFSHLAPYTQPEIQKSAEQTGRNVSAHITFNWQDPERLLASTAERRSQVAKALGLDKGEWVVALVSISCGDCEREALKLNWISPVAVASEREDLKWNGTESNRNLIAVAAAPAIAVEQWKKALGLNYRVESVTEQQFENIGAVILPTIVHIKDGQVVGATERAEVEHE